MLAWELVVEAEALRKQGWTITAIARHLGVTRVTVRQYLSGERTPGVRASSALEPFAEHVEYRRLPPGMSRSGGGGGAGKKQRPWWWAHGGPRAAGAAGWPSALISHTWWKDWT